MAAYAGPRQGELVALRRHDVDFQRRKRVVRRAVSGRCGGGLDEVPSSARSQLGDQAAGALDRLSQRGDFTHDEDYVFANRLGRRLDGSALRRRVDRARKAAGLRPLRFHDVRHTHGSLLVAGGIDLASARPRWASRASPPQSATCTRSASELADKFTRPLATAEPAPAATAEATD